jgi:outer membrane receptor for Fe3+-dicitrate
MRVCWCKFVVLFVLIVTFGATARPQGSQTSEDKLKQLSLEQLGDVEVTSKSKAPEQVWKTAAAIYVITQDDIRRSGVTTIPEALRLAPGVEVARIDANKWPGASAIIGNCPPSGPTYCSRIMSSSPATPDRQSPSREAPTRK